MYVAANGTIRQKPRLADNSLPPLVRSRWPHTPCTCNLCHTSAPCPLIACPTSITALRHAYHPSSQAPVCGLQCPVAPLECLGLELRASRCPPSWLQVMCAKALSSSAQAGLILNASQGIMGPPSLLLEAGGARALQPRRAAHPQNPIPLSRFTLRPGQKCTRHQQIPQSRSTLGASSGLN